MRFIEKAARRHGHTCPSLVYGCRMAAMLVSQLPEGAGVKRLVLHHSSSCLPDGVASVMENRHVQSRLVSQKGSGRCSLEATWPGGGVRITVRPEVKRHVDDLKRKHGLETFRSAGVSYLMSLADDDFAEVQLTGNDQGG